MRRERGVTTKSRWVTVDRQSQSSIKRQVSWRNKHNLFRIFLTLEYHVNHQAKTTKKITIRLECKECKAKKQLVLKRCKHFELGEKKAKTGGGY